MAASGKIVDLRNFLPSVFRSRFSVVTRLVTGLSFVDQTIGRLAQRRHHRINQPANKSGSASFIQALLQAAHRDRYFLALIDGETRLIHPP